LNELIQRPAFALVTDSVGQRVADGDVEAHDRRHQAEDLPEEQKQKEADHEVQQQTRAPAPEQLRKLLDELEALDEPETLKELHLPVLQEDSHYVRLARARSRLDQILRTLDVQDREAVSGSLVFKSLPSHRQWPRESQLPEPLRYALRPEPPKLLRGERVADELAPVRKRRPKLHMKSKVFVEPRGTVVAPRTGASGC
jgi:hypothetical protein